MPKIDENANPANSLKLSMDQANNTLRVQMPVQRNLEIFTAVGRLVMYVGAPGLVKVVNLQSLPEGEYRVKAGIYEAKFCIPRKEFKELPKKNEDDLV